MGLDDDHSICIWDWKKEEKLASTRGHKDMIFVIEWNPFNINYLVSVGEKHIKFWTQKSNQICEKVCLLVIEEISKCTVCNSVVYWINMDAYLS